MASHPDHSSERYVEPTIRDYPEIVRLLEAKGIDPDSVESLEYEAAFGQEAKIKNVRLREEQRDA